MLPFTPHNVILVAVKADLENRIVQCKVRHIHNKNHPQKKKQDPSANRADLVKRLPLTSAAIRLNRFLLFLTHVRCQGFVLFHCC